MKWKIETNRMFLRVVVFLQSRLKDLLFFLLEIDKGKQICHSFRDLNRPSQTVQCLKLTFMRVLSVQTFPTLSTPPQTKDWSSVSVVSELTTGVILRTVNHTMEHIQEEMRKLPEACKSYTDLQGKTATDEKLKLRQILKFCLFTKSSIQNSQC